MNLLITIRIFGPSEDEDGDFQIFSNDMEDFSHEGVSVGFSFTAPENHDAPSVLNMIVYYSHYDCGAYVEFGNGGDKYFILSDTPGSREVEVDNFGEIVDYLDDKILAFRARYVEGIEVFD